MSFAQQISPEEYESQTVLSTNSELTKLLHHVVGDKMMSLEEKKDFLTQFKESHLVIFEDTFGVDTSIEDIMQILAGLEDENAGFEENAEDASSSSSGSSSSPDDSC